MGGGGGKSLNIRSGDFCFIMNTFTRGPRVLETESERRENPLSDAASLTASPPASFYARPRAHGADTAPGAHLGDLKRFEMMRCHYRVLNGNSGVRSVASTTVSPSVCPGIPVSRVLFCATERDDQVPDRAREPPLNARAAAFSPPTQNLPLRRGGAAALHPAR